MREVTARMRLNIEAPAETDTMAAAETDTMAAAGTDTMAAAEAETSAMKETRRETAADGKEKERNWKDGVWWRYGGVKQSEYWNDPKWNQRSALVSPVWCETRDIRQV